MICNICQRNLNNERIRHNEDDQHCCMECLSLPFHQLNNEELCYEVNPQYNLGNLIKNNSNWSNNYNPFWLNNDRGIQTDNDIDPDSNYLFKQVSGDKCHYYTEESFKNLLQNENISNQSDELSLLHINIRSIRNKFDELSDYLTSLKHNFSIMGLTETWLTEDCANMYNIRDYKLITANRKNRSGGGVGMYIAERINYRLREDLSLFNEGVLETLFIELKTNKKETIVIGVLYRPPNSKLNEFEDELENLLSKINKENKLFYLMGDINIDMLKMNQVSSVDKFMHQLFSSSFYPLVTKPTRITDRSATLIDNILTNRLNGNDLRGILLTDISDHLPIFTIKRDVKIDKAPRVTQVSRHINAENIDKLMIDLSQEDWTDVAQNNDPNESYNIFYNKLYNLYNKALPIKTNTSGVTKFQQKPWLTKGIQKSLKSKNMLYKKSVKRPSTENKSKYKQYRNKLHHLIRISKKRYYKEKFEQTKNNIRQTWSIINEIINKQKTRKNLPKAFRYNNSEITDPLDIANQFNEYFANVGPTLAEKIAPSSIRFETFLERNHYESFFIKPVTEDEVEKELLKIDPTKSTGIDDLSPRVIQQIAPLIKQPLTSIFNKSFTTGRIPENLKTSLVTPVYKNEDESLFSNYRPVAVLPCFSKILERIMYNRLISFIEKHNILYSKQFGFRKNHSTETAIIDLIAKLTDAIDKNKLTAGIFLDLSKAFDTVNHSILITKLQHYGIRGITLEWFKNYLTNRNQIVKLNNTLSTKEKITCGVPQGSVLGPLLFLIYMNDIHKCSEILSFILFADDTNVFFSDTNIKVLNHTLNDELKKVSKWLEANKLTLNIKKTQVILFKTKNKKTEEPLKIKINDKEIKQVDSTKFLGINIDSKLTWKQHIDYIQHKISKTTGILCKARHYVSLKVLRTLYYALVYPYLHYGNVIWANTYQSRLETIRKLQKKIIRIITFSDYRDHTLPLFKKLSILPIDEINREKTALFMFRYFNKMLPMAFDKFFSLNRDLHSHNTRSSTKIHVDYVRTNYKKHSIKYRGSQTWNNLPPDIKMSKSIYIFKKKIKEYLLCK